MYSVGCVTSQTSATVNYWVALQIMQMHEVHVLSSLKSDAPLTSADMKLFTSL